VAVPRHFLGGTQGERVVAATAEQSLEGVVAKRLSAPYTAGPRSSAWIKLKNRRSEWFVVTAGASGLARSPSSS
jgi:bifunctional non-homologous end joining protein LigD